MKIGIPKENKIGEKRVAAIPYTVKKMLQLGIEVIIEKDAGLNADIQNEEYIEAGATITDDAISLFKVSDGILKIQSPSLEQLGMMKNDSFVISFNQCLDDTMSHKIHDKKITSFSMLAIPRISRAQKMDALSSQSSVAGYKSVLLGANYLSRFFPLLMTAAGTIVPAKVVVLGAGVAGLQAIATARRLGAVVEASDIRPQVKEQIESLGAKFIDVPFQQSLEDERGYAKEVSEEFLRNQREEVNKRLANCNLAITTALVPNKKAPILITAEVVNKMQRGSVIVDLAAEAGGNCELSQLGQVVEINGVKIVAPLDICSSMSFHASELYSKNILAFLTNMMKDGKMSVDLEDEIVSASLVTYLGKNFTPQTAQMENN